MKRVFWSLVLSFFLMESGAFAWTGKLNPEKIIQLAYRTGAKTSDTKSQKVKRPGKRHKKKKAAQPDAPQSAPKQ